MARARGGVVVNAAAGPEPVLVCRSCGARVDPGDRAAVLGWTRTRTADGMQAHCPACSHANARNFEAKTDERYW